MQTKKKYWWLDVILAMSLFIFGSHPILAKEETVDNYHADVQMAEDGSVTLTEKVTYTVSDQIEQLSHRITMNDTQELSDIAVSMQAAGQEDAFPFAESTNEAVGTFNASTQGNDLLVTVHNTMENEQQVATYRTNWLATWVKYGDKAVFDYPFFSLPYDVREATITFHFPGEAQTREVNYLVEGLDHYQLHWEGDQMLHITAYDIKADERGQLLVDAPPALVPEIRTEGPQSRGEQIAQHISEVNQATANRTRWQVTTLRIIFWVVTFITVIYIIALWYRKWRNRPTETNVMQWRYNPEVQTPTILPYISRRRYSDTSLFWLVLFQLVAEEHILMRWEYDPAGEPSEVFFRVRSRNARTYPEREVLHYLDQSGGPDISYQQLVYGAEEQQKQRPQKAFRKLIGNIKRQMKQRLKEEAIYDRKGNRLYRILWFIVTFLVAVGGIAVLILALAAQQAYWHIFVLLGLFLVLLLLKHFMFPIYTSRGIQLKRYFQQYLDRLPVKEHPIKGWALDYVYSWAIGKNREQYAMMEKRGIAAHHPVLGMFDPIHNKRLKELN